MKLRKAVEFKISCRGCYVNRFATILSPLKFSKITVISTISYLFFLLQYSFFLILKIDIYKTMKSAIFLSFATICLLGSVNAIKEDAKAKIEESKDASVSSTNTETAEASTTDKKEDESKALSNPLNGSVVADQDQPQDSQADKSSESTAAVSSEDGQTSTAEVPASVEVAETNEAPKATE